MARGENAKKQYKPRHPDGKFAYVADLSAIQIDMIMELATNGGNKTEACKKLNVPRSTLYGWLDKEEFKEAWRKTAERLYEASLNTAVSQMIKLMHCGDGRTALKACEDVMKLNGYLDSKPSVNIKTDDITITLDNNEDNNE